MSLVATLSVAVLVLLVHVHCCADSSAIAMNGLSPETSLSQATLQVGSLWQLHCEDVVTSAGATNAVHSM